MLTAGGSLLFASQIASCAVSVWFVSWALRRKYELDHKLTPTEQLIRSAIIVVAFGMTLLPGSNLAAVRIIAGMIGIGFVAWPNLAHHTAAMFQRFYLRKQSSRER